MRPEDALAIVFIESALLALALLAAWSKSTRASRAERDASSAWKEVGTVCDRARDRQGPLYVERGALIHRVEVLEAELRRFGHDVPE